MQTVNSISIEQAIEAYNDTPSYFERYIVSVEIENQPPLSSVWCYCPSCERFVSDENHVCEKCEK